MPHVTFIHGMANKPEKERLLRDWEDSLVQGDLDLAAEGVTTSMVYWADVMYAEPEAVDGAYEAVDEGLGTVASDDDLDWAQGLSGEEGAFVDSLREKLRYEKESPEGDDYAPPPPPEAAGPDDDDDSYQQPILFEAVPLPWFIKRRLMKRLLKDVYYYLFNKTSSPRPGESYQVQEHIRRLFVEQLRSDAAANTDGKHVVVSHSMGTVVAYDCLKNVADCPPVDNFMTAGCPLGISEVYDNLKPGYSRQEGFPAAKLAGEWVNVFDRLDPVALDARIANDYRQRGERVIIDQRVSNSGRWRHSSWKYFGQPPLGEHLRRLLDL